MSGSPEAGWGASQTATVSYEKAAIAIIDFLIKSQSRFAQAAQYNASFGGVVIGERKSLTGPGYAEQVRKDVNTAVAALNGIQAVVGGTPIQLMEWLGSDPDNPGQEVWRGQDPHDPRQVVEVTIDTASLRADYAEV